MLYHKDLIFPKTLSIKENYNLLLEYTQHALKASKSDKYGDIKLPKFLTFTKNHIIEIESNDSVNITKVVIRTKYDLKNDLCLVILLETNKVKTVWLNRKNDLHKTLDTSKYAS